jgi:hypothetical protein
MTVSAGMFYFVVVYTCVFECDFSSILFSVCFAFVSFWCDR